MWPKMLFEILPHVGRLVPMAEKFFATRGARDAEEQASLNAISETLRSELGRFSETHAGIQQALAAQREQSDAIAVEITRVRLGMQSVESRIGKLEASFASTVEAAERAERSGKRATALFAVVLILLIAILGMLAFLLVRVQGR